VGLATTPEHVERLLAAVADLAEHGPEFEYEHTDDGWVPVDGDPRKELPARPW
jgi:hypothetical protein